MKVEIVRGDITQQRVDAIVNAANKWLLGGGGVDGAIHHAGGPSILENCLAIRASWPDGVPVGVATATTAGRLAAKHVIHVVGPKYAESSDPAAELAACHINALRLADELCDRTVALPAISCGVYGYPAKDAAKVVAEAMRTTTAAVELARFVLFDDATLSAFSDAFHHAGVFGGGK